MLNELSIRTYFPGLGDRCYLNTAAEGIPPTVVKEALDAYWADKQLGMDGRAPHFSREAAARKKAARLVGLAAEEIGFCSCSAEAYNLLGSALQLAPGDEVVVSDIDFPSGFTPWVGPDLRLWRSCGGALREEDLEPLLTPRTRLVQVSLVSFFNGWRLNWEPFRRLVREKAPNAVISVDLTQALGRVVCDVPDADILISSTHKWLLGFHGSCVVGVPTRSADRLTTRAGGWYHLQNAFAADRFQNLERKPGAASYSVGMPSFAPIYALDAAMGFLLETGIEAIAAYSDPLVRRVDHELRQRGIEPLAPLSGSGIVAFRHPDADRIHKGLRQRGIHIMHQAGRLRVALHGYNTSADVERFFYALDDLLA